MPDQPDRPKLSIDEQLDRLAEGRKSLAQNVAIMLRENQKALSGTAEPNPAVRKMARSVTATARLVETLYAEHRLRQLEDWQRRLDGCGPLGAQPEADPAAALPARLLK